jgi:hypothetical protein
MGRKMKHLFITTACFSLFIVAPITAMLTDNTPPFEFDAANSYIIPQRTAAGRQITVHWKIKDLRRICPGAVSRTIVDADSGARTTYDPQPAAASVDTMDEFLDKTFMLPSHLSPGKKIYRATIDYRCNPLQHFWPLHVVTPDLPFEVVD